MNIKRLNILLILTMLGTLLFGHPALAVRDIALTAPLGQYDIVVDNEGTDPQKGTVAMTPGTDPATGAGKAWSTSTTNPASNYGANRHQILTGSGATFTWIPVIPQSGNYAVYVSFHGTTGRANPVPYEIYHGGTSTIVNVNQTSSSLSNGYWYGLDTGGVNSYYFEKGTANYIRIDTGSLTGWVLADAVRLVPLFTPEPPAQSSDATLGSLAVNPGELDFDPAVKDYTLNVVGSVYSSIDITPTVNSAVYQSLRINGQAAVSGATYTVPLVPGENLITIQVTAEDDTVNTYTLLVNRTVPSSEARLSGLTLSRAPLAFDPDITAYLVQVGDQVTSLDVTPTVMAAVYQSLTVNGSPHASGVPWPVELSVGENTVVIAVVAQDGTEKEYTVRIVRQGEAAVLSSLELSLGALHFSPWRTEYSIYAGHKVESLTLTPASSSGFYERMTVNDVPHESGKPYAVALAEGENLVTLRVYSNTGQEMVYTVRIHRLDSGTSAKVVNGKTVLPAEKLAEALGVKLLQDSSGLLVYSDKDFDFSDSGDAALREELLRLLGLRLTLDGEYAAFFNPAQKDYRLLLPSDGHVPVIGLEHAGGTEYAVRRATVEPSVELTVGGGDTYTFTFAEDLLSGAPASSLAGIKLSIEGEEEGEFVPTWIPVAYVDSNDGYANVNTPNKTVDNDLNTRWSANSAGETDWLRYDLGSKQRVYSMALAGYLGDERSYHFEVEISDDGQTWQPLLPMQHTSGATLLPEIYAFPENVETQYIRLLCYGYGPNRDGWNGVSEVRFYESLEQEQLDVSKWAEYFAPPDNKVGDQLKLQVKGLSPEGTEFALDPNTVSVRFFTDNAAVAQVDEATGLVTLTGAGTVRINAIAEQGDAIRISSVIIAVSE
ncbi:cadherin-like beta sandwich domain-containing protein [Paenibacillus sp. YN15]|uniref:cadherin-like beta sandwich domain-containing protein n=1 Tax=Paenibacillus sp. YN15 TaxID=1742774 RepID=UPI000DCF2DE6|nr:cadherin-like beta sandwich domain-containing protein [Paenibacillus sp. YN15]RAV06438.1 hypothetical protein DQG13_00960 [Paenibacillus sp. YN15]